MSFFQKVYHCCFPFQRWWFISLFFSISTFAYAQEIKKYQDSFSLNDTLSGEATFYYYLSGEEIVKHGPFLFNKTEPDTLGIINSVKSITLTGDYNNNLKNGVWKYSNKNLQTVGIPNTTDNIIVFKATGKDYSATAEFQAGKVHGNYEINDRNIVNSVTSDTLFFLKASYEEGVMQEVIEGKTDSIKVTGKLNKEGMPNGKWELVHLLNDNTIFEYREFTDGLLKDHYFIRNNETFPVKYIGLKTTEDNIDENWEIIPLGPDYFQIISFASVGLHTGEKRNDLTENALQLIKEGNSFLEKALSKPTVHKDRSIWQLTAGSKEVNPVMVKVRKYPFSDEEKKNLKEAHDLLTGIQSAIDTYLSDPYVNIGLHVFKSISYYYTIVETFQERIESMAPLINFLTDSGTEYLDRDTIIRYYFPEINYPEEISYEFNNTQYNESFSFPNVIVKNQVNINQIHTHLGEIFESVSEISNNSADILKEYKAQNEIQDKEELLLHTKDSLINLFTHKTEGEKYNQWHSSISVPVQNFAEKIFKTYAALSPKEKVTQIDLVFDCFNDLFDLYHELEDLPRKLDRIDEIYTRTIWNPYTFTYMDERVKERIYNVYENEIFPYVWEELTDMDSCDEISSKIKNIELLYQKMIALVEEDTKDLERQLRRVRNLEEILKALNLQLN